MSEMQLVAEGLRFPEGPVAMADGSVVVVEIDLASPCRPAFGHLAPRWRTGSAVLRAVDLVATTR